MTEERTILLTGVTGVLGAEIIKKLLQATDDCLYLLIRRRLRLSARERARTMLADWGLEHLLGTRVHILEGDVTEPQFGLEDSELTLLKREITHFFHIAALTALNGSKENCDRVNLRGTQNAIHVAWSLYDEGSLEWFYYFSTAYVAGSLQDYVSKEDELPEQPAHANYYEFSKYNAEKAVRGAMTEGLPVTVFRPSIVVGDSKTGVVPEFNVIYPFMKLFTSGLMGKLPADPGHAFNIVPIDFVVNAALAISRQEDAVGRTFHLVSEDPPRIDMLLELRERDFQQFPRFELVRPEEFVLEELSSMEQRLYAMIEPYMGYLTGNLSFDTANTRKALQKANILQPTTDYHFMKTLVQYAVDQGYFVAP
jgi:thioester reductase-like protein